MIFYDFNKMSFTQFGFIFEDRTTHFLFVKCSICGQLYAKCQMWESEYEFLRKLEQHQTHTHHAHNYGSTIGARVGRGLLRRSCCRETENSKSDSASEGTGAWCTIKETERRDKEETVP